MREAGKAAVKEAVADELAEERRVRAAVQKEMAAEVKEQSQLAGSNKASKKATSSSSSSSSKAAKGERGSASSTTATTFAHAAAICDCETADCSNCPGAQGMWKGKPAVKYNLIGVTKSEGCRERSIKKKYTPTQDTYVCACDTHVNHCIHTLRFAGKDAKAAAIKEENEALKKAEVAVATSNAILREVCVCVVSVSVSGRGKRL